MKRDSHKRTEHIARWIFAVATILCLIVVVQYQSPLEKELEATIRDAEELQRLTVGESLVRSGLLDLNLDVMELNSAGDCATVQYSVIGWTMDIQQRDDDSYYVSAPVGGSLVITDLVLEDGEWKILKNRAHFHAWESDSWYIKLMVDTNYKSNPEQYATFEEALEESHSITFEKTQNPIRLVLADLSSAYTKLSYSMESTHY
ncbi:MAG: hypothetical protein ACOX7K_06005 [Oscillospiraceae bacterium]|jgi:hypothetical protein